jgi:hypothetical protein
MKNDTLGIENRETTLFYPFGIRFTMPHSL